LGGTLGTLTDGRSEGEKQIPRPTPTPQLRRALATPVSFALMKT